MISLQMEIENCKEFAVGFCPNEEFFVESVTVKCPHTHSISEKTSYEKGNASFSHENEVFYRYKSILEEVDKKIALNTKLLLKETIEEKHLLLLNECEKMIENRKLQEFNFEKLHSLLIIHGLLIADLKTNQREDKFEVCSNCSAFKEKNKVCDHQFCKKYAKLRNLTSKLEKKLQKTVG